MIELDPHLHRPQRFDQVGLIRTDEAWVLRVEDSLCNRIEHPIFHLSAQDPDDTPHAGFGAMLFAQTRWERVLVEHLGRFIWFWLVHDQWLVRKWSERLIKFVM